MLNLAIFSVRFFFFPEDDDTFLRLPLDGSSGSMDSGLRGRWKSSLAVRLAMEYCVLEAAREAAAKAADTLDDFETDCDMCSLDVNLLEVGG